MTRRSLFKRLFGSRSATLIIASAAVILVFYLIKPTYLSGNNLRSVMNAMSLSGMICVGVAVLLICGEVDLAAGAEAMFGGIICGLFLQAGFSIPVSILFALIFGVVAGLINAFLVNVLNLMSFIASIGMSSIYIGVGHYITAGSGVNLSGTFLKLGTSALFNVIPTPFIVTVVLLAVYGFILRYTQIGRAIYMVGGNRTAARLTGINPKKITTAMFINNGVIASIAGVLLASRMHAAKPSAAETGALDAITAAVLGGVSFMGGVGGMGGCFIGILLLNAFVNGLTGVGLPTYYQLVAQGALLIIALSADYFSERARQRRLLGET